MVVEDKETFTDIAGELSRRGIKYCDSYDWNNCAVRAIVTNPKYAGWSAWGRTEQKLHGPQVAQPRDRWTMRSEAFQPLVTQATFDRAQAVLRDRTFNLTDEQFIAAAKALLNKKKRLSQELLKDSPMTPSYGAYRKRFGSMRRLYDLVGYRGQPSHFSRCESARSTRALRADLMERIVRSEERRVGKECRL